MFEAFSLLFAAPFVIALSWYQVNFYEPQWKDVPPGDCLLVMGSKVLSGNNPDIMMRERVDTAAKFITNDLKAVILTGGTVDEKKPEAEVMKALLIEKGIDAGRLILEREATSTYENLAFSKPLILKADCEKLDIVSHRFHLARVALTARRLGVTVNRLIPAEEKTPSQNGRIEREIKAYVWYFLGWNFVPTHP